MTTTTAMLLGAGIALAGMLVGGGLVLALTWSARQP